MLGPQYILIFLILSISSVYADGSFHVVGSEVGIEYEINCLNLTGSEINFKGKSPATHLFASRRPLEHCELKHDGENGLLEFRYQALIYESDQIGFAKSYFVTSGKTTKKVKVLPEDLNQLSDPGNLKQTPFYGLKGEGSERYENWRGMVEQLNRDSTEDR